MWSLTSWRVRRASGPENFQSSAKKDFFNTICQKRSFRHAYQSKGFTQILNVFAPGASWTSWKATCLVSTLKRDEAAASTVEAAACRSRDVPIFSAVAATISGPGRPRIHGKIGASVGRPASAR